MLVRVLFVLLVGVPACRGPEGAKGDSYSEYYDADEDVQNKDLYDSYNDEIKFPQTMTTIMEAITRLKRRGLEEPNSEEIVDVKEVLNGILQGKKPGSSGGRRIVRDYTETDFRNQDLAPVIKNWRPIVEVEKWTPNVDEQEYLDESSRQAAEQHGSDVYQTESSTYDKNIFSSSSIDYGKNAEEVQTWGTTEETEMTEDTLMYPLETTVYSISKIQADVKKLVQKWSSSSSVNMQESTTRYSKSDIPAELGKLDQHWSSSSSVNMYPLETTVYSVSKMQAEVKKLVQKWSSSSSVNMNEQNTRIQIEVSKLDPWRHNFDHKHWSAPDDIQPIQNTSVNVQHQNTSVNVQHWSPTIDVQQWDPIDTDDQKNLMNQQSTEIQTKTGRFTSTRELIQHQSLSASTVHLESEMQESTTTDSKNYEMEDNMNQQNTEMQTETGKFPSARELIQHQSLSASTVQHLEDEGDGSQLRGGGGIIDIDGIMDIISNLTYDYEWNLTMEFNKTIQQYGVPTCPWEKWGPNGIWTASTGSTEYPWNFENTSVVSKCFVCGLQSPEIPRDAHCADAFAGDFLPLMPIDARSRGKIAGFRKYCRYIDTQNYIENPEEPRAIYGRFTGGCAVRWTDLTGVYTQRTCRSKFRPLMGKHLASKRMAKLELALVNVENGCIISPMATLLPVSRGISLYARFHACVCSTNWCNRATLKQASSITLVNIVLAYWLVHYP